MQLHFENRGYFVNNIPPKQIQDITMEKTKGVVKNMYVYTIILFDFYRVS